jgi:hypothetical protein
MTRGGSSSCTFGKRKKNKTTYLGLCLERREYSPQKKKKGGNIPKSLESSQLEQSPLPNKPIVDYC